MSAVNIADAPIESWPIGDVKPYPLNHKKHPPKSIQQLAASIKAHGLNDPITVDEDGVIISGHGRLQAVTSLGWTHVPIRCLKGLTKGQADALRIAANKTTSQEYDYDILQAELHRLSNVGEDIGALGLDEKELSMMLEDLGDLNVDMTSADIVSDVSEFEEAAKEDAAELLSKEVSATKLLGFTKLPATAKKTTVRFLKIVEEKTGKSGAEGFLAFMEDTVKNS